MFNFVQDRYVYTAISGSAVPVSVSVPVPVSVFLFKMDENIKNLVVYRQIF